MGTQISLEFLWPARHACEDLSVMHISDALIELYSVWSCLLVSLSWSAKSAQKLLRQSLI